MGVNKCHAQPIVIDGHRFASKREGYRYGELKLLLEANEIEALELQPSFPIEINGTVICKYVADFRYVDRRTGEHIVEDVKGVRTPLYKLKRKMMMAFWDIEVLET